MTGDHAELIARLTELREQVLRGFRRISRLEEAEILKAAIRVIKGAASSVPVRASGEPKWVSAARKLVAGTRLIKTGDGVHLLEMALADYDHEASASPSDDGARQPPDRSTS